MDDQAQHYSRMKQAVWLYLYLLLNANRRTGLLLRKLHTIAGDMGVNRDCVIRWLSVLRAGGYVTTTNTGRSLTIQILRWKPLAPLRKTQLQQLEKSHFRSWKYPTPDNSRGRTNPDQIARTRLGHAPPNETKIEINILNEMQNHVHNTLHNHVLSPLGPQIQREAFAQELAARLHDPQGIPLYRALCHRYPEGWLRKVLAQVQQVPDEQITKSRAALFTHLVQRHAQGAY